VISFAMTALGFLKRVPWQVWVIAAVAMLWWFERDAHGEARYAEGIAKMEAARQVANAAALAARASEEEALRRLAKDTDNAVITRLDQERSRTERFIAAGGVRNNQVCPRRPAASSSDYSTGNGQTVRETSELDGTERLPEVVAVLPDDVRICTDNTIKAEEWRKFILGLEEK
jgi:hypothetical protein